MPTPTSGPTTLPFTDGRVWPFPAIALVIAIAVLFVGWSHRGKLVRLAGHTPWREAVAWGAALFGIVTPALCGWADFSGVVEHGFTSDFGWKVAMLILSAGIQLFCLGVVYFKGVDKDEERAKAEKLAKIINGHDQRRDTIAEIVNAKAQSIRRARRGRVAGKLPLTVSQVSSSFQPRQQMLLNLIGLHRSLRHLVGRSGRLRVAVFLPTPDGSALDLLLSYDGKNTDCINTPKKQHADQFRMTGGTKKCLAVYTAKAGGLHLIPNTDRMKAQDKVKYEPLDNRQKNEIKSICSYGYVASDDEPHAVIIVDSNEKKALRDDSEFRKLLEVELQEFGNRLLLEADIEKLLN